MVFAAFASTAAMADGAALYNKCAACHGANGEKKALNKSMIISSMSVEQLVTSMKGYQDGTYGGAMKALMKGQLAGYSADDIKAVAEYIAK